MEFVILGFFTALGKFIVLWKLFGIRHVLYFEKWVDLMFTIGLPILFLGTFSGALLAVFSGLWLSLILRCTALFIKPEAPWSKVLGPRSKQLRR